MHFVIEQHTGWDIEADSMEKAIDMFLFSPLNARSKWVRPFESYSIVCQETEDEDTFE
jgi:hypothetical protein